MSSTDHNVKNATAKINELKTVEEVFNFVAGDERKTVQEAATIQIDILKAKSQPSNGDNLPKQGEVNKITNTKQEFKDAPVIHKSSVLTMRNSKPTRVFFNEKGIESGSEVVETK